MIDSHTHLDHVPGEDETIVTAARQVGVNRILTIGMDPDSCRHALNASEQFEGTVFAAVGRHPNASSGFDESAAAELQVLAGHPCCRAIGETGLDYYRDHAPREDQKMAFAMQIELARETKKPLIIHTRAAEDDTIEALTTHAEGVTVVLRSLSEGLRVVTVLLHPYMPQKTATVLAALGDESLDLQRAELGAGERGQAVATLEPLFPRAAK